mgnify:CR=1 FL=1
MSSFDESSLVNIFILDDAALLAPLSENENITILLLKELNNWMH